MVRNRACSPENLPPRRPVINARRHVPAPRNAVDHIAVVLNSNNAHIILSEDSKKYIAQEDSRAAQIKSAKRPHTAITTVDGKECEIHNVVDHVQRIRAGEQGRKEYFAYRSGGGGAEGGENAFNANSTVVPAAKDTNSSRPATPTAAQRAESPFKSLQPLASRDVNAAQAPSHPLMKTLAPPPKKKTPSLSDGLGDSVMSVESRPATPRGSVGADSHAKTALGITSPAPRPLSATRPQLSFKFASATEEQANVKAAYAREESANEKSALEYYGDIGVGLGITSRKKAVAPPKESYMHPITGLLLPSARAASANKMFDRSGMSDSLRKAIASGEFDVPLEKRRSSIALHRAGSASGKFGSFSGRPASPVSARFTNPHAMREAHPSESSHTKYLFGSSAIAEREAFLQLPRKVPHPLDDTTYDKDPTPRQLAQNRRQSYAVEMVAPRFSRTNVSSFDLKDDIPTHAELLKQIEERPSTRRGVVAQQYNDTTGFFDPAPPLPRAQSPHRGSTPVRSGSVCSNNGGGGGAPMLHTTQRAEQRRASSVDATCRNPKYMSALEWRASHYNGNVPPMNTGTRRPNSPIIDTSRVLCPQRQPAEPRVAVNPDGTMGAYTSRVAQSPARRRCQAAAAMDLTTTPALRARGVDVARPTGIRANFSAFQPAAMAFKPVHVSHTQQSHLWGLLGDGSNFVVGGNVVSSRVTDRPESPRGKRRVDSPARSSSICLC